MNIITETRHDRIYLLGTSSVDRLPTASVKRHWFLCFIFPFFRITRSLPHQYGGREVSQKPAQAANIRLVAFTRLTHTVIGQMKASFQLGHSRKYFSPNLFLCSFNLSIFIRKRHYLGSERQREDGRSVVAVDTRGEGIRSQNQYQKPIEGADEFISILFA